MVGMLRTALLILTLTLTACASSDPPKPTPQPTPAATTRPQPDGARLRQQWLDMFARSYFPGRSGQVFVVPKQGWFVTSRDPLYYFMHGSPWDYDVHIPILFHGAPFVKAGSFTTPARQQDVAPTIGAIIGATPLPTYTGHVLSEAVAAGNGRPRI